MAVKSWPRGRCRTTTRSSSWAWRAGSPAVCRRPRTCGGWCWTARTRSPSSRPTAAGTSTRCSPATTSAPRRRGSAASCTTRGSSTRRSSGCRRGRRSRPTRSSACCWRPRGRRSSAPGSTRCRCGAAIPVSSPESCTTTTRSCSAVSSRATTARGRRRRSRPAGCPMCSVWRVRPSRSTRPAPLRWSRCTSPRSRCGRGSRRWRSPVVSR